MGYYFCIKKQVLHQLDYFFDEHLIRYAYAEDLDFTCRYCVEAKKQGMRTVIDPNISANHLGAKKWRVSRQEAVNYLFANRRYFSWKLFARRNDYRAAMWLFDHLYLLTQLPNKEYAKEIRAALKLCKEKKSLIKEGAISKLSKNEE